MFLQGTNDYLHNFLDQSENTLTWHEDVRGCRDACIEVYENLLGLRGPQQRPTETWWGWIDAMPLNTQRTGGAFFSGLLIFSNTAVDNKDLADQQACRFLDQSVRGKGVNVGEFGVKTHPAWNALPSLRNSNWSRSSDLQQRSD